MTNKDWWESFSPADCLKTGSWEDMTDYIQHSACTDFTIYSECTIDGQAFRFTKNSTLSTLIGGGDAGDDLKIIANDINAHAFIKLFGNGEIDLEVGANDSIRFKQNGSQFFEFDYAGTVSWLMGSGTTGDDLKIIANQANDCASIILSGNGGIVSEIKAASGFEVSTCSLETLWEIDSSPADKHIDFHCLDAHNFVLELRTSDPSSPTCTGQIWFRTDLV